VFEIIQLEHDLSRELPSGEYVGDGFGIAKLYSIYYSHDDLPSFDHRLDEAINAALKTECCRIANEGAAAA
jgi:hypothetical protein